MISLPQSLYRKSEITHAAKSKMLNLRTNPIFLLIFTLDATFS